MSKRKVSAGTITRREMLKGTGVVLGGLAVPGLLEACLSSSSAPTSSGSIKIGFVSPITGPAAGFGEPDGYVLGLARKAFQNGITIGGTNYTVEIVDRDGQSTPSVGAQVAQDLIQSEKVDLMLTTSTPETVVPVSAACEAAHVPCISTVVPWEAWYLGMNGSPTKAVTFNYAYHYCFGVAQFLDAYTHLWPQVSTNKKVGVMYPNDADGNAIRGALAPALHAVGGYTIVDPGAYNDGTNDYTAQIQKFIAEDCEIFNTFPIPPDFATFWQQAHQQGYTKKVKIAQIAKTGLFPSQVISLGAIGDGLASAVYWGHTWPYKSSLTGVTCQQLADGYEAASGKQWNQQLGASMSLFDVASAALKASGNPKDKSAVASAIKTLAVDTIVGHLDWTKPPTFGPGGPAIPNVQTTPIIGGQWKSNVSHWPLDFVICENSADTNVPVAGTLQPYTAG
ncbi:MAG TPA: ABC transporter substrate-binding protein [Candidatus Dormibacteraeota bacterium]|nr:ABC transporter substrate-binding protein [Candidatus Dormibacteraeota bacterium]